MRFQERLIASFLALGVAWTVGWLFCALVIGTRMITIWIFWGTAVLMWVILGLPLIGLGDRVFRISWPVLALIGGLGGALLMLAPNIAARLGDPQLQYAQFSMTDLAWPAAAFAIAGSTTALYRFFLHKARAKQARVKEDFSS